MDKTIRSYASVVEQYCKVLNERGFDISFNTGEIDEYIIKVKEKYDCYKNKYLRDEVEYLDRHKMAAILVTCGVECKIINSKKTSGKTDDEKIDIGVQKILLLAAFDYLLAIINSKIDAKSGKTVDRIKKISYPEAFTCPTQFIDILSRTLYYAEKDYQLNEMELAEKFFLLEYISILKDFPDKSGEYFSILKE